MRKNPDQRHRDGLERQIGVLVVLADTSTLEPSGVQRELASQQVACICPFSERKEHHHGQIRRKRKTVQVEPVEGGQNASVELVL